MERIFDMDEYQKGGSILRMLWDYMSSAGHSSARLPGPGSSGHSADVCQISHIQMSNSALCLAPLILVSQSSLALGSGVISSLWAQ